jgi:phosphoglycerol transferase MdoB-like AlkP superfamily enzyme
MEALLMIKQGSIITMTYPFGLLLSLFAWLTLGKIMPRKAVQWYGIITLIIFGSYVIGQDVYVRIFNDYFSFKEALTLREGIESGESMYRFSWLHPTILVIMIGSVTWFIKQSKKGSIKTSIVQLKRSFIILIMLIITLLIQATYPTQGQTKFSSDLYLYRSVFSRKDVARHFGFFHLMGRDIIDTLTPPLSLSRDEKTIEDYIQNHPSPESDHEYEGLFEGKNLIFILAESYDEIALDPILTPHLAQLQSESITFNNHFTPVFQRTTSDT